MHKPIEPGKGGYSELADFIMKPIKRQMNVQVKLEELTKDEIQDLVSFANSAGWKRENPRKKWTEPEQKEAIRYAVRKLVHDHLDRTESRKTAKH